MVTWNLAFKNSIIYCIYYCIWAAISAGIMFGGMFIALLMFDPYNPSSGLTIILVMFGAYGISTLLCFFGAIASLIKVAGDAAEESITRGGRRR
ncbi:MAG: hypothetical protein ACTSP4_11230 [Candidatus Hodarchaeales archaeon]